MKKIVIFLMLLASPVWAATETFYICHGGDGSAPETATCATAYDETDFNTAGNWDTDDANDGKIGPNDDVAFVDEGGSFTGILTIQTSGLSGKPITLKAQTGDTPVFATRIHAADKDYITVQGLTITNSDSATAALSFITDCNTISVLDMTITNPTSHGIYFEGGQNVTIDGNTVTAAGDGTDYKAGIYAAISGATRPGTWTVTDNTLEDNYYGMILGNINGVTITGNEAHDNQNAGIKLSANAGYDCESITIGANNATGNSYGIHIGTDTAQATSEVKNFTITGGTYNTNEETVIE